MMQTCFVCNKLIKDGDEVTVEVSSTYHILKSTIAYALDKYAMKANSETLRHKECNARDLPVGD